MKFREPITTRLTPAERDILERTLSGLSMAQIAHQRNCGYRTVSTIKSRAYDKLGVSTDRELWQWYGLALAEVHGETIPATAVTQPNFTHLEQAA